MLVAFLQRIRKIKFNFVASFQTIIEQVKSLEKGIQRKLNRYYLIDLIGRSTKIVVFLILLE